MNLQNCEVSVNSWTILTHVGKNAHYKL